MTVTVYDAVDVTALPADTEYALGYIDGRLTTGHAARVRARFPHAKIITVTTTGTSAAMLCDCETGNATARIAAQGVAAGLYGAVYCNEQNRQAIDQALHPTHWDWWAVDWTGTPHIVPGSVATQYASSAYDTSLVDDAWITSLFPPPPTEEETAMKWGIQATGNGQVRIVPLPTGRLVKAPIATPADLTALEAMGAVAVTFDPATLARMPTLTP